MKLIEALELLKQPLPSEAPPLGVFLACGFTPLHLQTFLAAQLRRELPGRNVRIDTGLFGDLIGNIQRLDPSGVHALVVVVVEWADLDPRLGIRSLGGWRPSVLQDIEESTDRMAEYLQRALLQICRSTPTVVCMPTLPLPPLFWTPPDRAARLELRLHRTIASLASRLSDEFGIHVLNAQALDEVSPLNQRFDVKSEVTTGFPYALRHASALAEMLAGAIGSRSPKKGLITDLDNTLWRGILGEDGVSGISWHLDRGTHMHGLYQQFAASLAGAGVLIGVASKNDSALVEQAFRRDDLLIQASDIFPREINWGRKSESVRRILETWNVGADSVVFIDDNPMEVAEVKSAFPEVEGIVFPTNEYQGIFDLLKHLRRVFGKAVLTEDDSLRMDSIRTTSAWKQSIRTDGSSSEDFLRAAEASIVFSVSRDGGDARALELINKTNQFNLNGRRLTEGEWASFCGDPATMLLTASYKDKYGALGKIAVILGKLHGRKLQVHAWVMSCRAFSRRIEHHCLRYLFESLGIDEIAFDYEETARNGPLREFMAELFGAPLGPGVRLSRQHFIASVPALFHHVEGTINV